MHVLVFSGAQGLTGTFGWATVSSSAMAGEGEGGGEGGWKRENANRTELKRQQVLYKPRSSSQFYITAAFYVKLWETC